MSAAYGEAPTHAGTTDLSDKQREVLELRTIRVSTKAALRAVSSQEERERIKTVATELLGRLESAVIRDGADPELIAELEATRRELWDQGPR